MEAAALSTVTKRGTEPAPRDDDLLARIAVGDETALAELYDLFGRLAFGLALRVVRDRDLAEDAVQEAFLGVWRSAARFRSERGTARAWILSLVHRRAVDVVRREERRRVEHRPRTRAEAQESAEEAAWLRAERRRVQDALEQLPESLRGPLELAYYGGLSQSQIAARLGLPLGTVKSRTSAALDHLRRLLGDGETARRGSDTRCRRPRPETAECMGARA